MSAKFCDFCGAPMNEGETVCSACGHFTANADSAQPSYQASPSYQQAPPPYQQPMPQYQQPGPLYPQPGYINPPYPYAQRDTSPMSMGDYLLMIFLSAIPLAGFILLLVWAFDSNVNINKRNYARAYLIFGLVVVGLFVVICIIAGIAGASSSSYSSYGTAY